MKSKKNLLGSVLLKKKLISKKRLKEALCEQMLHKKPLGAILIQGGDLTRDELEDILLQDVKKNDHFDTDIIISKEVIRLVDIKLVREYDICPIQLQENSLYLGVADILTIDRKRELQFLLDWNIEFLVLPLKCLRKTQKKYYELSFEEEGTVFSKEESLNDLMKKVIKQGEQASVIDLVDGILVNAIRSSVNDIHLESVQGGMSVRCRVDGVLIDLIKIPVSLRASIVSRIKVLADLNITETRLPQDGRIDYFFLKRGFVQLRISTLPTIYGESVVIRILAKNKKISFLTELGLSQGEKKTIEKKLNALGGLILVTGPTGSGKTTTLYSMIKCLNTKSLKIMTLEDPIEYDIDGVIQSAVREKIGLTFEKFLKHLLRQDLDVLMLGEIRDKSTISIAVRASLTGHLVLSSLHTNNTVGAVIRFLDMGIEPFLITATMQLIVAQRLLKTLCPFCKESDVLGENLLKKLGLFYLKKTSNKSAIYRPKGCNHCKFTGYDGRIAIFELLTMSESLKQLLLNRATEKTIFMQAQKEGMISLCETGLQQVFSGIVGVEDLLDQTFNALE